MLVSYRGKDQGWTHERRRLAVKSRAGFTLVELLLALVLLDLGLVALVSASAAASRVRARAQANQQALALASARIERMLATPCRGTNAAGIEQPSPNIDERWTETPASNGIRYISDSITITEPRGVARVVLRAADQC